MRDKTFDEVLNNVFNELVLLGKELINYKEQIAKLKKQNEALNLEKSEAWECIEMHYKEEIYKLKKQKETLMEGLEHYESAHYDFGNRECSHDKTATDALKKVEGMK